MKIGSSLIGLLLSGCGLLAGENMFWADNRSIAIQIMFQETLFKQTHFFRFILLLLTKSGGECGMS